MEVALQKMGNSTALVVPPAVLKDLGMGVGRRLTLDTTPDGKIVLTPKRKYVLSDLIAQCDLKARRLRPTWVCGMLPAPLANRCFEAGFGPLPRTGSVA
jgi:antitoxin ChpS